MKKSLFAALLTIFLSFNSSAIEVAGVKFEDAIANTNLKLNGAGIRYKVFFKIYAAALYVQTPSTDQNNVITQDGEKRIVMHILYDDIDRKKMVDSMIEGFEDNLSDDERTPLQSRIDELLTHYQGVKEGDVLMFDYKPNQGTTFSINGTEKTTIKGSDFNQALLKIWVGDEPATSNLKQNLLGIKDDF